MVFLLSAASLARNHGSAKTAGLVLKAAFSAMECEKIKGCIKKMAANRQFSAAHNLWEVPNSAVPDVLSELQSHLIR
jgi:hypothetical protein